MNSYRITGAGGIELHLVETGNPRGRPILFDDLTCSNTPNSFSSLPQSSTENIVALAAFQSADIQAAFDRFWRVSPHGLLCVAALPCRPGNLDEVLIRINGQQHYLWRAVDQDGDVIDILVQPRRDQRAAERFFRRLLRGQECT